MDGKRLRMSGRNLAFLSALIALNFSLGSSQSSPRLEKAVLYRKAKFDCSVKSRNAAEVIVWWQFQGQNVTSKDNQRISVSKSSDGTVSSELTINKVSWDHGGNYSCLAREINGDEVDPTRQDIELKIYAEAKKLDIEDGSGEVGETARMSCTFQGKPLPSIKWLRHGKQVESDDVKYIVSQVKISHREIKSYLEIHELTHDDNGTYLCDGSNEYDSSVAVLNNVVYGRPEVILDLVKPVDKDQIFVNWTAIDWNSPITDYFLFYRKSSDSAWVNYISERVPPEATSFVVKGLTPETDYLIKIGAQNKYGQGEYSIHKAKVKTLNWSPLVFVPTVSLKGLTWNSISIGWTTPESDLDDDDDTDNRDGPDFLEYIRYYRLTQRSGDQTKSVYVSTDEYPFYLWMNLEPATNHEFSVAACNGFTRECGRSSNVVSGITEDGLSGQPSDVSIECHHDNVSKFNYVDVKWKSPLNKNGRIEFYNILLRGVASYLDESGVKRVEKFGPEEKTVDASSEKDEFQSMFAFLTPNTNYTARICAVTRRRECGKPATVSCKMPSLPPATDKLSRFEWDNWHRNGKEVFRLKTPKLSERNGPICCFRVVVLRMRRGSSIKEVEDRNNLRLTTYKKAHENEGAWGAYVAEIHGPNSLGEDVFVGDGYFINAASSAHSQCPACRTGHLTSTNKKAENPRVVRNVASPTDLVEDGFLDPYSNYTAYVEVIVPGDTVGRSPFMSPHKPGEPVYLSNTGGGKGSGAVSTVLICVLGVLAGLVTVAVFLLVALLFLRRYSKQVAASQGGGNVEMDLVRSFRHFISNTLRGGRDHSQYLITPNGEPNLSNGHANGNSGSGKEVWQPADIAPIKSDDLVAAYLERHKDSDYGFQAEFELLPDKWPDRTTAEACDRNINRPKNRYPDIRCYDQTRVKLSPLSTIPQFPPDDVDSCSSPDGDSVDSPGVIDGSDYINANFVRGYEGRKMWICAQGPLEHTVADFWRMIYEQGTTMIIMLTNLEEYNRVKCAQYWPGAGDTNYVVSPHCLINVGFCTEKRYSDYIVRELTMSVRTQKKNEDKATTIIRTVRHYHYLQWKDFNAPEHAPGMLRFVKRINEQHFGNLSWKSSDDGLPPIVVHCSAGVGRSGTLIAIDSLIQMLEEKDSVSIYQLVCELRHSRNYLVQSVKQYMFVYRAIMEVAQFGDTEIDAGNIKNYWKSMSTENLNKEFAKLANIVDDRKALSVGTNEENQLKNQSEMVIPFDRNRVILTPDGMKPHSTYINASFIEGYHNDESFIITQDPLPNTAEDFWRMATEHSIKTMVQLTSTENEDQAWLYYPEKMSTENGKGLAFEEYGSMRVSLDSKEDFSSYVMRDFTVYSGKADESVKLTHFAFKDWTSGVKTEQGTLPRSTQGLLDLIEHATAHKTEMKRSGPIAVHCKYGSDRSSVYVALSCLVQQLKTESRADVFSVVRKLRSQRQGMVQSLKQYKFIYQALCDYVDLYNSKDDEEYQYSVPINSVNSSMQQRVVMNNKNGSLPKKL